MNQFLKTVLAAMYFPVIFALVRTILPLLLPKMELDKSLRRDILDVLRSTKDPRILHATIEHFTRHGWGPHTDPDLAKRISSAMAEYVAWPEEALFLIMEGNGEAAKPLIIDMIKNRANSSRYEHDYW